MICSTTTPCDFDSSYGPGVADTNMTCPTRRFPLLEVQRPVVERRRQAEPVGHQHFLARSIAEVHAADLRHGLVALVDDDQRIAGQVVEQRRRRLARRAAGQVPRVVLDAVAVADLTRSSRGRTSSAGAGAALRAACPPTSSFDRYQASSSLIVSTARRVRSRGATKCDFGIDRDLVVALDLLAGQRVERDQLVDLVAEQLDAKPLLLVRRDRPRRCRRGPGTCRVRSRGRCARTGSRPACGALRRARSAGRARAAAACRNRLPASPGRRCTTRWRR